MMYTLFPMPSHLMSVAAAEPSGGFPLLSLLVFLPALGALLMALAVPGDDTPESQRTARQWGLGIALAGLLPAGAVVYFFDPEIKPFDTSGQSLRELFRRTQFDATGLQIEPLNERYDWMAGLVGSRYHLAVDGTNVWLILLAVLAAPLAVAAGSAIEKRCRDYFILVLLLQTSMLGAFLAQDLLLFYFFFEFTLVPAYLLIGIWGGPERKSAAGRFFLYTFTGSVLTLAGLVWLAVYTSQITSRPVSFDLQELYTLLPAVTQSGPAWLQAEWTNAQVLLFVILLAAFAVKIPLFPFHSWQPAAYAEAPIGVTVLLAAVLSKLGTFGLLRIAVPLCPQGALLLMPWVGGLAACGVLYAALVALRTNDLKRLLAFSSLSHMGWIIVGLLSFNVEGLGGAVIQMVSHGLSTAGLFLVVGFLSQRTRSTELDAHGGLWQPMPVMALFLMFFSLASIGLPGLSGFVGEFLILVGVFSTQTVRDASGATVSAVGPTLAVLTAGGIVLGAWYTLNVVRGLLMGSVRIPLGRSVQDFGLREVLVLAPLAAASLGIGVAPWYFLKPIEKSTMGITTVIRNGGVEVVRNTAKPRSDVGLRR